MLINSLKDQSRHKKKLISETDSMRKSGESPGKLSATTLKKSASGEEISYFPVAMKSDTPILHTTPLL